MAPHPGGGWGTLRYHKVWTAHAERNSYDRRSARRAPSMRASRADPSGLSSIPHDAWHGGLFTDRDPTAVLVTAPRGCRAKALGCCGPALPASVDDELGDRRLHGFASTRPVAEGQRRGCRRVEPIARPVPG